MVFRRFSAGMRLASRETSWRCSHSRSGGMAAGNGPRGTLLRPHTVVSDLGTVRPGEPAETSSRVDSCESCGRTRTAKHQSVKEPREHRDRFTRRGFNVHRAGTAFRISECCRGRSTSGAKQLGRQASLRPLSRNRTQGPRLRTSLLTSNLQPLTPNLLMHPPRRLQRRGIRAETANGRFPHALRRGVEDQIAIDVAQQPR
jgi:hypothetical protein